MHPRVNGPNAPATDLGPKVKFLCGDVADTLVRPCEKALPHGTVLDIGMGQCSTILEVAKSLMKAIVRLDERLHHQRCISVAHIRYGCADIETACTSQPKRSEEEGLSWARSQYEIA